MKDSTPPKPRGEAAWRAQLDETRKRNDAARARGLRERQVREADTSERLARQARREAAEISRRHTP